MRSINEPSAIDLAPTTTGTPRHLLAEIGGREAGANGEGLDALDHRYINCIAKGYEGGPVGIETIAAALSEPRDALEEIVEPYLIQQGFIQRTPRGRMLTALAFMHLNKAVPQGFVGVQASLFEEPGQE